MLLFTLAAIKKFDVWVIVAAGVKDAIPPTLFAVAGLTVKYTLFALENAERPLLIVVSKVTKFPSNTDKAVLAHLTTAHSVILWSDTSIRSDKSALPTVVGIVTDVAA